MALDNSHKSQAVCSDGSFCVAPALAGARVALGMSGGVDSAVAASLLMEAGYEVVGVTCIFVDDERAQAAVRDASATANALGIAHVTRDCTDVFSCEVVRPFVQSYAEGLTPSPCVGCNVRCKISALIAAADELGCEFVATGHYARVVRHQGRFAVAVAAHAAKDQSYMLSLLPQEQLARLVLPLGGIAEGKELVRRMARDRGLPVASKSDSQDICFIEGSHLAFLEECGLEGAPGNIVTTDGRVVGRHGGLFRYTIGQRKGLEIGGAPEPYYVVGKRVVENELVVGFAREALIDCAHVADVRWQGASVEEFAREYAERGPRPFSVKLRYRQQAVPCMVSPSFAGASTASMNGGGAGAVDGDARVDAPLCSVALPSEGASHSAAMSASVDCASAVNIVLDEPQSATAPGQFAVVYDGDVVVCAGVIERTAREGSKEHGG